MSELDVVAIALAAVVIVVLAEHLAIWSLFFKRGWKVSVPPAPKQAATDSAAGTADTAPVPAAVPDRLVA